MSEIVTSIHRRPNDDGYEYAKQRILKSKDNENYKLEKFSTHAFGPRWFMRGIGDRGWTTIEYTVVDAEGNILWVTEKLDGKITQEVTIDQ